jgi:hypothetical protein
VRNESTPEEYWAGVEEDIGEPIHAYALARIVSRADISGRGWLAPKPQWGLVFVTGSSVYVDSSSEPNWYERLVVSRRKKTETERLVIPIDSIREIIIPPPKTGLSGFLAGPETGVDIVYAADRKGIRLVLDRRARQDKKLLEVLATLAGA